MFFKAVQDPVPSVDAPKPPRRRPQQQLKVENSVNHVLLREAHPVGCEVRLGGVRAAVDKLRVASTPEGEASGPQNLVRFVVVAAAGGG